MKTTNRPIQILIFVCALNLTLAACSNMGGEPSNQSDDVNDSDNSSTGDSALLNSADSNKPAVFLTGTLSESEYYDEYVLSDDEHGASVSVTTTDTQRRLAANGLPNHEVGDFPNDGNPNVISKQDILVSFPLNPTFTGEQRFVKEPGITISGVKLDPQTAERATCDSGISYGIEAIQDSVNLGLDFNNAHVQPTGAYHYHAVSEKLIESIDTDQEIVHVGFAYDGFMIYYSRNGAYKPSFELNTQEREGLNCSYEDKTSGLETIFEGSTPDGSFIEDWNYVDGLGDLDECNGIEVNGEYAYFMTDTYPYIGRCLNGVFEEQSPVGGDGNPENQPPEGPESESDRQVGEEPKDEVPTTSEEPKDEVPTTSEEPKDEVPTTSEEPEDERPPRGPRPGGPPPPQKLSET